MQRSRATIAEDKQTARLALEIVWHKLAPLVDEARDLAEQIKEDPKLLSDSWVEASTKWLQIFEVEIDAIQTVYCATEADVKLSPPEIRAARRTSETLLRLNEEARQKVENKTTQPS